MLRLFKRRRKTWQELFQQDEAAVLRHCTEKLPKAWDKMERCGFRHILEGGGNWQRTRR